PRAPARRLRRWDILLGVAYERAEGPGPEAPVVGLRPLPAVLGILVLQGLGPAQGAVGDVAAEAVADEDRVLALRPARREARARYDQRVAMQVVDVGVHGV